MKGSATRGMAARPAASPGPFEQVYRIVRRIPPGRVMTYGQIAGLLGNRLSPLAVGWAMHACPEDVPWQRVVNARGGCSTDRLTGGLQRALLRQEGVRFGPGGNVPLERYRWAPRGLKARVDKRLVGAAVPGPGGRSRAGRPVRRPAPGRR